MVRQESANDGVLNQLRSELSSLRQAYLTLKTDVKTAVEKELALCFKKHRANEMPLQISDSMAKETKLSVEMKKREK